MKYYYLQASHENKNGLWVEIPREQFESCGWRPVDTEELEWTLQFLEAEEIIVRTILHEYKITRE